MAMTMMTTMTIKMTMTEDAISEAGGRTIVIAE